MGLNSLLCVWNFRAITAKTNVAVTVVASSWFCELSLCAKLHTCSTLPWVAAEIRTGSNVLVKIHFNGGCWSRWPLSLDGDYRLWKLFFLGGVATSWAWAGPPNKGWSQSPPTKCSCCPQRVVVVTRQWHVSFLNTIYEWGWVWVKSYKDTSFIEGHLLSKVVFHLRLSSVEGHLPLKAIFLQSWSYIEGCFPSKVFFCQRLSSIKGCFPWKVFFHWRSSSIKGHLPSKLVLYWSFWALMNVVKWQSLPFLLNYLE